MEFLKNNIIDHARTWVSGLLVAGILLHSTLLCTLAMLLWLVLLIRLIRQNNGISRTMQIVYGILAVLPAGYIAVSLWSILF